MWELLVPTSNARQVAALGKTTIPLWGPANAVPYYEAREFENRPCPEPSVLWRMVKQGKRHVWLPQKPTNIIIRYTTGYVYSIASYIRILVTNLETPTIPASARKCSQARGIFNTRCHWELRRDVGRSSAAPAFIVANFLLP